MNPISYGAALFEWLAQQWRFDSNTHGWLIIAVSLGLVWLKRAELRTLPREKDLKALMVIATALVTYTAGCMMRQPLPGLVAIIALTWAIPYLFLGSATAERLFFPCAYLIFAIPNLLSDLTQPLRVLSSTASTTIATGLGIDVACMGTIITIPGPEPIFLDIADECSGIRSLIVLVSLSAAYASVTQETFGRKLILVLFAIPLAVLGNVFRCSSIIMAAKAFSQETAIDMFHVYAPRIIFFINVLIMTAFGEWLKKPRWKHTKTYNPASNE